MKGKAIDICPRCKHYLGMTPQGMYSCGYANDGSELNIGIDVVLSCANFKEVNMNKVEGKVGEFCPKCKNCKSISWGVYDEKNEGITEVECEDPYDGMIKTLYADNNICCSMFEAKPPCEKCERFDGIYCHNSIGNTTPSCTASYGEPGNCPSYEEKKKEEEPCDKISLLKHELEMDRLRKKIHHLEKEKAAHMKGIDRLKKSQEKLQNQVKNLQTTNEESYKREEKLEDKCHKLERRLTEEKKRFDRLDNEFLMPLARVLYPGERVCKSYSDILKDIKDLKIYSDENGRMFKELQEWREKCIARGNDIDVLLSVSKEKDKKISELESHLNYWSNEAMSRSEELTEVKKDKDKWRELYNSLSGICSDYNKRCKEECEKKYRDEISKLQNIVTEKDVEIKGLKKDIINLSFDRVTVKSTMDKNAKLKQTITDQEVTIKALLITIKEMCKEENENA